MAMTYLRKYWTLLPCLKCINQYIHRITCQSNWYLEEEKKPEPKPVEPEPVEPEPVEPEPVEPKPVIIPEPVEEPEP